MDVCLPFGYSRKEVVYDAIDDCSRYVFARVMQDNSEQSSIDFVRELIKKCPFPIEAVRTDQGKEFSRTFTGFLKENNIRHFKNPAYTPQHNGKIERYHRTFKENEACHWSFHASQKELNYRIQLWLNYYNFQKKHTGLGMNKLTPAQKIIYAFIHQSFLSDKNVNLILQQNNI